MDAIPAAAEPTNRQLAGRVFAAYLKPRWKGLAVAIACGAVVAALTAVSTQQLKPAFDTLSSAAPNAGLLLRLAGLIVVLALARAAAQIVQATFVNRIGHGLVGQVQTDLFGRLVHADFARLRSAHTGAFVSQVLYDAGLMREGATRGVINYSQNALTIAGSLIVMAWNDWILTLGVLLLGPLIGMVIQRYTKRTRKAAQGAMAETAALSTAVMESLDGIKIVKIEGRESYEQGRVGKVVERRQAHIIKGANANAQAAPVTEALTTIIVAGLLAYAGWRAASGQLTGGGLVAFLVALLAAGQSLRQLAQLQSVLAEGLTAARRLFAAMDVEPEVRDAPGAAQIDLCKGTIRFDEVSFAYGPDAPALRGVTLSAKRGETVALVGPSGGGKSTILNLIPRFYDATAGAVTLDGQDVRGLTLASLRAQIALVTQEPFLFDDTIRANIAYARPDATDDEIEEAARQAAAHDFIMALPRGYDTGVGEAGARLSGGQRQRIAIARAFLKDAPVLLLDEATSALDTESEAQVQAALERLMAGRTVVLIAHRLSTVKHADRIYVIDAGRVAEEGTHLSLVRRKGLYARLAKAQDLDGAEGAVPRDAAS